MVAMLTNANGSGSYLISAGDRKKVVSESFAMDKDNFVNGLVSRKKQLLPGLIEGFGAK